MRIDPSGVSVERALPGTADQLSEIAMRSKAHWGYPERWMEMWRVSLTISPGVIEKNPVYLASVDGSTIGFYALLGQPPVLDLDQLWVLPEWIGQGVGGVLIRHAIDQASQLGARMMTVQADPHAEGFYRHMGARRVGEYMYQLEGQTRVLPKLVFEFAADGSPDTRR